MGLIEESDSLHQRVQQFARGASSDDTFESLALAIARFQTRYSAGFARLVEQRRSSLDRVDSIPGVPAFTFRLARVAVHPESLDQARFYTSGTSVADRGMHPLRRLDTYRTLAVSFGERALASALGPRAVVVALAPRPEPRNSSSLACMMRFFMEEFDGVSETEAAFESLAPERWLIDADQVKLDDLRYSLRRAREQSRPLLLLATAFALVHLLELLPNAELLCPESTLVMVTGGFKGKSKSIAREPFRRKVAALFGINEERVVGEYGMTELTSQLYEGTAPGAWLEGPLDVYLEPPWLRASAVDPVTLERLPDGEVGVARFVDLGNIDSAVAIVTDDLIRRVKSGVQLLGRRPNSTPRGCSLALESLVQAKPAASDA